MLAYSTAALAAGFLIDLILGDLRGWPHIVRGFGLLIAALEKLFYPMRNKRLGGALLVACTLVVCAGVPAAALLLAWRVSPWLYFALESLICWQCLAVKSLRVESRAVYDALEKNDLPAARKAVSMIVGRDTERLDEAGVTRAAVETIAENASDGVAAPLLFLALGGAALGCLYKAVNTMDSMIGYKNDRYLDFGRYAAKLDDALNFSPARLCALVMIAACGLVGLNAREASCIWRRDRRKHASPNSAQTESVMAGALGVRLAGDAYYFGTLHEKPYIGDDARPIEAADILRAHRMLYAAAWLTFLLALLIRGILYAAL
ncbi:MAG TPA: adenosylcobinamide-phosphate synthase CbiB [Clostridia bacterium]|nr:adenosylcobinamide-phosphate synthase CbiB [Clostridia bacterium]